MPGSSVMQNRLTRVNNILEDLALSIRLIDEAKRPRKGRPEADFDPDEDNKAEPSAREKGQKKAKIGKQRRFPGAKTPEEDKAEKDRDAAYEASKAEQTAAKDRRQAAFYRKAEPAVKAAKDKFVKRNKRAAELGVEQPAKNKGGELTGIEAKVARQEGGRRRPIGIQKSAAAFKQMRQNQAALIQAGQRPTQQIPAQAGDTDKATKLRFARLQAQGGPAKGDTRTGEMRGVQGSALAKAAKLMNMRLNRGRPDEKRYHDHGRTGHEDPHPRVERPANPKYHVNKATGKIVHSTGKHHKFANRTTFRSTPDDAMLHTDKSPSGARGSADKSEFVVKGADVNQNPLHKWYRVSPKGGYASAMASLGKAYHKDKAFRRKVISAVKGQVFHGADGRPIKVKPTGALHNERTMCMRSKTGELHPVGQKLQRDNPQEFYRLCKGPHGPSGSPDRDEYKTGFDPKHTSPSQLHKLHRAALAGKAEKPTANIAQHIGTHRERAAERAAERAGKPTPFTPRGQRRMFTQQKVGRMIDQARATRGPGKPLG